MRALLKLSPWTGHTRWRSARTPTFKRLVLHQLVNSSCFSDMAAKAEGNFGEFKAELKRLGGGGGVKLDKDDQTGIAVITLQHEEHRNSITALMMTRLDDVVSELRAWPQGKGVILWGGEVNFCSGADLQQVREVGFNFRYGNIMSLFMQQILTCLHQLPLVSVALVSGKAIGGGAELTTACDFRLMTTGSEVQFVQAQMGVVPGWGGATRLVRLLGREAALDLLLTGRRLNVEEALKLGFANGEIAAGEAMLQDAKTWLGRRTRAALDVVRAVKRIVVEARELPLQQSSEFERQEFTRLWGGPAQQEALDKNIKHR